jgi:hypothetical protein
VKQPNRFMHSAERFQKAHNADIITATMTEVLSVVQSSWDSIKRADYPEHMKPLLDRLKQARAKLDLVITGIETAED